MLQGLPILSLVIWEPIVFGIAVLAIADDRNPGRARWTALAGSVLGFLVAIPLWTRFANVADMQFVELHPWITRFNLIYHPGVAAIAIPLILRNSLISIL